LGDPGAASYIAWDSLADRNMTWQDHITVDPNVCHGKACFTGTRVLVSVVLDSLAAGESIDEVLTDFPSITRDGVLAAIAYASELSKDRVLDIPA
jgi:uncharacterized protein (DUF433 family)